MFSGDRELLLLLYVWKFVECRINTNTRTYSHPGGRPRGEGLAPPLRPTHTKVLFLDAKYVSIVSRLGFRYIVSNRIQGRSLGSNKQFRASASVVYIERGAHRYVVARGRFLLYIR